ncbi:MAG: hypothetical protein GX973_02440 [Firmicutes bacterium]|nr:hypothetical protein [Bacillota bacterium]
MERATENKASDTTRVLEEANRLLEDLIRQEKEIRRQIVSNNPRELAAIIASSAEIIHRGERLMALLEDGQRRSPGSAACPAVVEKLLEIKILQEVNRTLLKKGLQMAPKLGEFRPLGEATYNRSGQVHPPAGKTPTRLDRDC